MKSPTIEEVRMGHHMHEAQIQCIAIELIKRGARSKCINALLPQGPNKHKLASLQKTVRNKDAPKMAGRLPNTSASMFKTPEENIAATSCLLVYKNYSLAHPHTPRRLPNGDVHIILDPLALCFAYDESDTSIIETVTSVWFLARDERFKTISIRRCNKCHAQHIYFNWVAPNEKQNQCPHCQIRTKA